MLPPLDGGELLWDCNRDLILSQSGLIEWSGCDWSCKRRREKVKKKVENYD